MQVLPIAALISYLTQYFWRMTSGANRFQNLAKIASHFNWTRVGILSEQTQYSLMGAQTLAGACADSGINVGVQLALKWSADYALKDPTLCFCGKCKPRFNMTTCHAELAAGMKQLKESGGE